MDTTDFRDLLSKPLDEVQRPKSLPVGTYEGIVASYRYDKSGTKQTPFVEYTIRLTGPGDGMDPNELEGIDVSKRQLRKTFYITEDAMWRCKDFLEKIGVEIAGRSFGETIPEAVNRAVLLHTTRRANPNKPGEFFDDVGEVTAA
jgi:hypothetical protein